MRGVIVQAIAANAAGKISEDSYGHVGDANHGAAWVLDGATGLGDKNYVTGAYSDAAWYAGEFSHCLQNYSLTEKTPQEIFAAALTDMHHAWGAQVNESDLPRYVLPSAAGVWLRWRCGELEAISMGDCRGWHIAPDGKITLLAAISDDPNDAWLAAQIAEYQQRGISPEQMRAQVMPILRAARSQMNLPGGYDIFSIHPETAQRLQVRKLAITPGHIILCSDGLFRWVDVLQQGSTADFLNACIENLSAALHHVRTVEIADADCTRFVRLKRHDDATGIVLRAVI